MASSSKRLRRAESSQSSSDASQPSTQSSETNGSVSDHSSPSPGRGRARGRGRGRGCDRGRGLGRGRGRGRGHGRRGRRRGHGGVGSTSSGSDHGSTAGVTDPSALLPVDETQWVKAEPNSYCYQYTQTPGPTQQFTDRTTALEFFTKYFTDDVWNLLVTKTNRYAHANVSSGPHSRAWNDVTIDEMKAFIGMLILFGIIKLPRLEMFWQNTNEYIGTPGIAGIMSRNRFEQIFRFLHLADNACDPGNDKLYKVRRFTTLLTTQFQSLYTLHQQVTVDEAMIPFKGRLSF